MHRLTHVPAGGGRLAAPLGRVLRRTWTEHDGIALALSLLVMGVLTIATAAVITASTSNERAFGRDRQTSRALNIAEAGLNAAVAALKTLPADAVSLPPGTGYVTRARGRTRPSEPRTRRIRISTSGR